MLMDMIGVKRAIQAVWGAAIKKQTAIVAIIMVFQVNFNTLFVRVKRREEG